MTQFHFFRFLIAFYNNKLTLQFISVKETNKVWKISVKSEPNL